MVHTQSNTLLLLLFQTAKTCLILKWPLITRTLLLFDNESQKSFFTSQLCRHLKLKKIRCEVLTVKTFANVEESVKRFGVKF